MNFVILSLGGKRLRRSMNKLAPASAPGQGVLIFATNFLKK